MKKLLIPLLLFASVLASCKLADRIKQMSGMPEPSSKVPEVAIPTAGNAAQWTIIEHTGFTLSFNKETLLPDWVAWELTSDETGGESSRNSFEFMPDETLDESLRVLPTDYKYSGFDRGHMCPAGDMKWSEEAMHDCHYMTNICPQVPVLNQQYWERLESACRRWAKREGSICIVCGPIFNGQKEFIGRDHEVRVPNAFFKVVLSLREGHEKAIGFYYTNDKARQNMEQASRSVDEIERITGFDFFSSLPDELENRIESEHNLQMWTNPNYK